MSYETRLATGPLGNINGYVSVPANHPWYGISYHDCPQGCGESFCDHTPEARIDVHGGLTYSSYGPAGEKGDGWWFGFDTAHLGDGVPGLNIPSSDPVRSDEYVQAECDYLAKQLKEVAIPPREN